MKKIEIELDDADFEFLRLLSELYHKGVDEIARNVLSNAIKRVRSELLK
ncbi:MAG: hypothetical protein J7L47_09180 [Candidatus Odinarchaeota archaeon]|nr:hypothetical protein [Candidatus Odinarchaeota archaeon]